MNSLSTRLKVLGATGLLLGSLGAAVAAGVGPTGAALAATTPPTATVAAATGSSAAQSSTAGAQPAGAPPFGPGGPRGGPDGFLGPGSLDPLATYLGIATTDLQTALRNGQTLAQIGQAHGKSASDLKTFLTAQLKTRLDQDVASGRITSQQETDRLANASTRIDQQINGTFSQGFGHAGGPGPGFGGGPALVQTTAQTLGMTTADVQSALQSGQTLAQIAQAHGKTSADLENALLASYKARLDQLMTTNLQQLRPQPPTGQAPASAATATPTPASG